MKKEVSHATNVAVAYPIHKSVPRFVSTNTYATSFGYQWHRFRTVQLDSHTQIIRIRADAYINYGLDKTKITMDAWCSMLESVRAGLRRCVAKKGGEVVEEST